MNWTKAVIAGVLGGIAVTVADFVMHGVIMQDTYMKYDLFTKEEANPLYFALIAICIGITVAFLFAKTRGSWGAAALLGLASSMLEKGLSFNEMYCIVTP